MSGLLLPGWFCFFCQVFNGSAKEERTHCRSCGEARKEGPAPTKVPLVDI